MTDEKLKYSENNEELENFLRPDKFSDFEGQQKIVNNLKVFIEAAKQRNEALDHV